MRRNYTAKHVSNVILGNFRYQYSRGELCSISWVENGKAFIISTNFAGYPKDLTDTFIGKLLNKNTAQAALEGVGFHGEADPYKDVELAENPLARLEIYSQEEYEKHFQAEGGYPERFLRYEDVSRLGEFVAFFAQSNKENNGNYSKYSYMLRDPVGQLLTVNILSSDDIKIEEIFYSDKLGDLLTGEDLRRIDTTKETGRITESMYTYFYRAGKLEAIAGATAQDWGHSVITIAAPFHTYPTTDTPIGRMLNGETAKDAIKELGLFREL